MSTLPARGAPPWPMSCLPSLFSKELQCSLEYLSRYAACPDTNLGELSYSTGQAERRLVPLQAWTHRQKVKRVQTRLLSMLHSLAKEVQGR